MKSQVVMNATGLVLCAVAILSVSGFCRKITIQFDLVL